MGTVQNTSPVLERNKIATLLMFSLVIALTFLDIVSRPPTQRRPYGLARRPKRIPDIHIEIPRRPRRVFLRLPRRYDSRPANPSNVLFFPRKHLRLRDYTNGHQLGYGTSGSEFADSCRNSRHGVDRSATASKSSSVHLALVVFLLGVGNLSRASRSLDAFGTSLSATN